MTDELQLDGIAEATDVNYPPPWRAPATTRWWLAGDGTGTPTLTLMTEYGGPDDPAVLVDEPERPDYTEDPVTWLSPFGIGMHLEHEDGAAGWVWWLTMEHDRDEAIAKAEHARKRKKRA